MKKLIFVLCLSLLIVACEKKEDTKPETILDKATKAVTEKADEAKVAAEKAKADAKAAAEKAKAEAEAKKATK
jgi:uncharacterized protein YcfL